MTPFLRVMAYCATNRSAPGTAQYALVRQGAHHRYCALQTMGLIPETGGFAANVITPALTSKAMNSWDKVVADLFR